MNHKKLKLIISSGYAGVLPDGRIVDRRVEPTAVPIPANVSLGVPAPQPVAECDPQTVDYDKLPLSDEECEQLERDTWR